MVKETSLPDTVGIQDALSHLDFHDSFATTNKVNSLNNIVLCIFGEAPKWVGRLFRLRNFIVQFIGLKTDFRPQEPEFIVGGHIGFFEIFSISPTEVIIGADDSHLNFRASIFDSGSDDFNIQVSTLVQYNNRLGRLYMFVIKPFHRMVVKAMIKQAYVT